MCYKRNRLQIFLSFCAVLCIALSSALAQEPALLKANASSFSALQKEILNLNVKSMCEYDNALLLLTNDDNFYICDPYQSKLTPLKTENAPANSLNWLVNDNGTLYVYSFEGFLYKVEIAQGCLKLSVAAELFCDIGLEDIDSLSLPEQVLISDGALYALYRPQSLMGLNTKLFAWDIESGSSIHIKQPDNMQGMFLDSKGRIISVCFEVQEVQEALAELFCFNPKSGQSEYICSIKQKISPFEVALAYLKDGTFIYAAENKLYKKNNDGKENLLKYIGDASFVEGSGSRIETPGDKYCAYLSRGSVVIFEAGSGIKDEKVLNIWGEPSGNILTDKISRVMRGIDFNFIDVDWNYAQRLAEILISKPDDIDVMFLFSPRDDTDILIDKGYLMDLSDSRIIKEHLLNSYPIIQNKAMRNDSIYLVPIYLDLFLYRANVNCFKELGINIPYTFEDLCSYLENWQLYADKLNADVLPVSFVNVLTALRSTAIKIRFSLFRYFNEEESFDTPLLRKMLKAAEKESLYALNLPFPEKDTTVMLSATSYSLNNFTWEANNNPENPIESVIIRADKNSPPVTPVSIGYLAISSKSKKAETALKYLEAYVENLDAETRIMLYPNKNEPVKSENIDEYIASKEKHIAELESKLKTDDVQLKNLLQEDYLKSIESLNYAKANYYYITEEVIKNYRDIMHYAVIKDKGLEFASLDQSLDSLIKRYIDGEMPTDQFIKEADQKLRLMKLETQ